MASPDNLKTIDYSRIERRMLAAMSEKLIQFPSVLGSPTGRATTTAAGADLPPPTAEELFAKLKRVAAELPPRPAGMPSLFSPRPASFGAMNVIVVHPPEQRKRSWKARLFSRPWRPWQRTEEGPQHPLWGMLDGDNAYRVGDTLYVSPVGYAALAVAAKLPPIPV